MRKYITSLLYPYFPVYPVSLKRGHCSRPYVVLKFTDSDRSQVNLLCYFVYFEVYIYVPDNSICPMKEAISKVKKALKDKAEFTGKITSDYYDENAKAYMRSMQFKLAMAGEDEEI